MATTDMSVVATFHSEHIMKSSLYIHAPLDSASTRSFKTSIIHLVAIVRSHTTVQFHTQLNPMCDRGCLTCVQRSLSGRMTPHAVVIEAYATSPAALSTPCCSVEAGTAIPG